MHFTDRAAIIRDMPVIFPSALRPTARFCALLAVLFGLAGAASAQTAPQAQTLPGNPYGAIVPVPDESPKSRDLGLRLALIQVLKGAVGRTDQATSPILALAPKLVQQSTFLRDETSDTPLFKAVFDSRAVDNALRAQGLPVFGLNPDLVEAWIVQVRGLDSAGDYSRVVRHFTRIRGVRKVDVDELHDDVLRLRMIVEGGVDRAAQLAEADGLIARDETGAYVLARR